MRFKTVEEEFPPAGVDLLVRFKHGIIDCCLDEDESDRENNVAVGYAYIWRDQTFYIYSWMLLSDFEASLEKEEKC